MKKFHLFLAVLFSIVSAVVVTLYTKPSRGHETLVSPELLAGKTIGLNQWFPQNMTGDVLGSAVGLPEISAKAAIFVDSKTGQVLYAKNIHQHLPIASLVKVMTVVVALEHRGLDDVFTVSQTAANMEPDKMQLITGEKLSLKELLYGIFLISANDAAEVIAENTTGRKEEFVTLMNSKAKQLGMEDTFYVNPTGLDEDDNNSYSSAYDLTVLTRYVVRNYPVVTDITNTEHMYLPQTLEHQDYDMYSGINLLTTYPGVVGFKTGYTPDAGLTLITLARKNGHEVIGVILGSEDRRDEAKELLDYSFSQLL